MPLAADIASHRDQIVADLIAVHDYYADTSGAWAVIRTKIAEGGSIQIQNAVTGNVTTEHNLVDKSLFYVAEYLTASTFQQFVALFEDFIFGFLRHWLLAFPQRLGQKQVPVSIVFAAPDLAAVKLAAVNNELHELSYRNVREWFAYVERMVKLGCPSDDEIGRLAEIKATRDLLVHNRGVANATYEDKAGKFKRGNIGERIGISEAYHRESWALIRKAIAEMSAAAVLKLI